MTSTVQIAIHKTDRQRLRRKLPEKNILHTGEATERKVSKMPSPIPTFYSTSIKTLTPHLTN